MQTSVETDPHTQTAESDPLSLGPTQEVQAVSVAGRFSSAQVYFVGPDAWIQPAIVVRLYGRSGGGRLLLSEVPLSSAIRTRENGTTTALAIVVQGIHVEGFEVVVAQGEGDAVSEGRVYLIASTRAEGADIRPGLPAALQPLFAQGSAAAQSGRWPVFLSDGSAEVGSATNALHVRKSDRRAAYFTSAIVGSGTSVTSTPKSVLYVWNGRSGKRAEIRRVTVAYRQGGGSSYLTVRGTRITAQASPAGGTTISPLPLDPSDGASALTSVAAASTPSQVAADLILFAVPVSSTGTFVWTWTDLGKPIVLPADMDQGFEIRTELSAAASAEMKLYVTIEWLEVLDGGEPQARGNTQA